jgi:hypothetical protein
MLDVYLRIQRLNYSSFDIDSKIQSVITRFSPENKSKQEIMDSYLIETYDHLGVIHPEAEHEFSYY